MPTIARLNQVYSNVNLAGHLQDTKLGMQAQVGRAVVRGFQGRNLQGFPALRNRTAVNMHFMLGATQTGDRVMSPLTGLQLALRLKQGLSVAKNSLYPIAELAFGRGQQLPPPPPAHFFTRVSYLYDCASQHGVMGSLLERMPRALAARAERSGWMTTAKACLVGAILGRAALQVPRALICAWTLAENLMFSAAIVAAMCLVERTLSGVKWAVDKAAPQRGQQLGTPRLLPNDSVSFLRAPFFAFAAEELVVDNLGAAVDDAGPDMNQRVAQRMNAALRRFANEDETVDDGRLVREMADQIVADLRRFCARAPDDTAFRGGVALLRDFIELTYDEAGWVAPEEV